MKNKAPDDKGQSAESKQQEWYDAAEKALPHVRKLVALHNAYMKRYNALARAGDTESEEYEILENLCNLDLDTVLSTLEEAFETELP